MNIGQILNDRQHTYLTVEFSREKVLVTSSYQK